MQQPSPAPAPPTPAAPPPLPASEAPSITVLLPDGPMPLAGLPRTAQEVQGLRARREILRDQLSRASNRRDELVGQLNGGIADEARAGVQQRLELLDQRMLQIERDQALTERQLSSASPEVLALTAEVPNPNTTVDEDDAVLAAFGTFGVGVLLTLFVGRLRRRFGRRHAAKATATVALAADPRLDQLTQAVDAIALEVERIGEGQRFVTQVLAGRHEAPVLSREAERR